MTETPARSLRIHPGEVMARLADGGRVRFLDVRGQVHREATPLQIVGSERVNAVLLAVEPDWAADDLLVVYCT